MHLCPENEKYGNCSSRCLELCKNRFDPIACPIKCDEGCFCRGARLRNKNNKCVAQDQCEQFELDDSHPVDSSQTTCPPDEVFMRNGNRCKELCKNIVRPLSRSIDCSELSTGCLCREGFFRNVFGVCVERSDCDQRKFQKIIKSIFNVLFHN